MNSSVPLHLRLLLPALALGLGVALDFIQPVGLLAATLFIAIVLLDDHRRPQWLWWLLGLVISIALAAHLVPGFLPTTLALPQRFSLDADPVTIRLSWDKLLVGLTLLAWWLGQRPQHSLSLRKAWHVMIATLIVVPTLALALGLVAWQPKWPDGLWLWLLINLSVAVLAEELLFRAWLQPCLVKRLGAWPGVLLTAALFGAAHIPFSPLFALVAAVAGLGYGLAFHYSGRLHLAIVLHGAVNLTHMLLLSYPLRLA
ncbi:CPBP family intramembrane glutamic endopeptidase [Pseudomonas sp. Marseille-Q8238]